MLIGMKNNYSLDGQTYLEKHFHRFTVRTVHLPQQNSLFRVIRCFVNLSCEEESKIY